MTDVRYGASPSDWDHLTLVLGLQEHLLPVVSRPDAPISEGSALKRLGQIPSLYNPACKVCGFGKWTEHQTRAAEIARWREVGDYGICIQTRALRAFDCDITHEDLAAKVYYRLKELLTALAFSFAVRGRSNACKFLIPFRLDGPYAKRVLHLPCGNEGDKIEFLADGQQFIAVGTHPSGVRYEWRGGLPSDVMTLSSAQFEHIWTTLKTEFNGTETRDRSEERKPAGGTIDDDRLSFLEKAGAVLGWSAEGAAYVSCPFKSGHSKEGDITETIYFPKGLRGYERGHFKCLHASCSGRTDDDYLNALGYTESMFDVLPEVEPANAASPEPFRFAFTPIADFTQRAPQAYIIKKIMPKADLVVLFGESGSGKSFIALDMAFAIARGTDWNGHKTSQGRVAYVCAEGSGGFQKRAQAYASHYNVNLNDIPIDILADQPNLLDTKDATALTAAIQHLTGVSVIFIDTFAQTTPGANENSAEDIGKALKHCRAISKMTGAVVVLIHHAGKDLTKGARGWSGLRAAADAELEVSRSENYRNLRISKQKDGEDGAEWGVVLREIPVGVDEDDSILSSCIVEYTAKQKVMKKEKKLGPIQQLLVDAFVSGGEIPIAEKILSRGVIASLPVPVGRDTRSQRVQRALEELIARGVLVLREGKVGLGEE